MKEIHFIAIDFIHILIDGNPTKSSITSKLLDRGATKCWTAVGLYNAFNYQCFIVTTRSTQSLFRLSEWQTNEESSYEGNLFQAYGY